ncbi:MAG: DUF4870 domain-containing protein [Lentisphaeria bacterium]|jgi:uncharacterized Tic20 family protein
MTENHQPAATPVQAQLVPDDHEKQLGLLLHLSFFAGFIVPIASILVPLIIWLLKRDNSKFIDDTGKEVLNFQISLFIYSIIAGVLCLLLIGFLLLFIIFIAAIVCAIQGAIKANQGETYRYPYILRLLK